MRRILHGYMRKYRWKYFSADELRECMLDEFSMDVVYFIIRIHVGTALLVVQLSRTSRVVPWQFVTLTLRFRLKTNVWKNPRALAIPRPRVCQTAVFPSHTKQPNNQANQNQSTNKSSQFHEPILHHLCCPGPQPAGEGSAAGLLLPKRPTLALVACGTEARCACHRKAASGCGGMRGRGVSGVPECTACRLLTSIGRVTVCPLLGGLLRTPRWLRHVGRNALNSCPGYRLQTGVFVGCRPRAPS